MLNEFLKVAYRLEQQKTASRQLVDKLKGFDITDLIALADGDPTAKLAYIDSDGPQSWLDKYKGSPLFSKAVELEKALLEADAASDSKRTEERESDRELETQRDSLRMQKRMLDLDLALEQEGGAAGAVPEVPVEQTPAPAQPAVEVKSASAVGTLIPEARSTRDTIHPERAQGAGAGDYNMDPSATVTEGLQVNKTAAVKVTMADAVGRVLAKEAGALQRFGQLATGSKANELGRTAKGWTRAAELTKGRPSHDLAASAADRVGAMARSERVKSLATQGAVAAGTGAVGAGIHHATSGDEKTAAGPTSYDELLQTELLQRHHDQKATSAETHPIRSRMGQAVAGGLKGGVAGLYAGGLLSAALKRAPQQAAPLVFGGGALGALAGTVRGATMTPGAKDRDIANMHQGELHPDALRQDAADAKEVGDYIDANSGKVRATRGAAGAVGGGLLGAGLGSLVGRPGLGALAGGVGGGLLAAAPRPSGAAMHADAAEIEKYMKTRGMPVEKAASQVSTKPAPKPDDLYNEILKHFPSKKKEAGIGAGLIQGVKSLGTGAKTLATTAHAAGGVPQVAKSFGNVAKGFAQKNPLAVAGAAGLGGAALGRATAPSR